MKRALLITVTVILAVLAFSTLASAEAINDEAFVLKFDAGDAPAGTELPLWGENGECLVWYINSENKLVSATTSELSYGYTAQNQSNTQSDYGNLPLVPNAPCLSSISIGETVIQDTGSAKRIVVANLHDVDFDYIYTNSGSIFANNDTLQCLYLPDDITRLPEKILYNATHLVKFDMGESVVVVWNNAFVGCSAIERVDFSNTCLYFPAYTFKDCTSLKEVHLGNSIKNLQKFFLDGTGNQQIDLYVPVTVVGMSFGAPYNNYLTIFYTGTLEEAQANLYNFGVVNYTFLPYSEFDGTRTTVALEWYAYYGVSPCVAYDKGVHEFTTEYAYPNGLDAAGQKINTCTKKGCSVEEKTDLKPLFEAIGYSIKEDGTAILGGFKMNSEAIRVYNDYLVGKGGNPISYGILVTNKNPEGNGVVIENGQLASPMGMLLPLNDEELEYSIVNYAISGFLPEKRYVDAEFIISFYVAENGKMSFIQSETAANQQKITCNGEQITLNTISLRTLADKTIKSLTVDLESTSDEKLKERIRSTIAKLAVISAVQ